MAAYRLLVCCLLSCCSIAASSRSTTNNATLRFAASLTDHALLQRAPAAPVIWGFAAPGAKVEVTQSGSGHILGEAATNSTTADAKTGIWKLSMTPVAATTSPYQFTATSQGESVTIKDVIFGDVFVCGE